MDRSKPFAVAPLAAAMLILQGCASDGTAPTLGLASGADASAVVAEGSADDAVAYDDNASYAGRSVYSCDDGQTLDVSNQTTSISIAMADGTVMTLPASPADSRTRYVEQQVAFVFDGEEALFFRPKTAPATCRRKA